MYQTLWTVRAIAGIARLCLFASLLTGAVLSAAPAEAGEKTARKDPTLEEALKGNAPKVRDFLWGSMKHPENSLHVGVLKFLVQIGENPPGDNAGPLNLHMASRLEAALILSLDDKDNKDRIRILHNPSAVVWKNANFRANLQTPEGRKAFFDNKYPPAWSRGDKKISADVFLTGLVKMDDEARTVEVSVQAFDKRGEKPVEVCKFKAGTDPRLLTEAGVSFALPRGGNPEDIEKLKVAWEDQERPAKVLTSVPGKINKGAMARKFLQEAPIDFQILYNGEPIEVRADGTVPEPNPNDKVTFRLKHKNQDENTYGVVLKINGENTISPEKSELDDFAYHKWVLAPESGFEIKGYQGRADEAHKFKTLPAAESKREEMHYGPHVGTFTVVIFQGRRDDKESQLVRMNGNDLPAIGRGVPAGLAKNNTLKALQGQLQAAAREQTNPANGSRGLVGPGERTKQRVEQVDFKGYAIPVRVIQIRYYKPQSKE